MICGGECRARELLGKISLLEQENAWEMSSLSLLLESQTN